METFKILYTLFGGLGIFFYGMKMMSDSLQAIAGDVIQKVINSLTTNRFLAVVVGIIVTMIVQSSSVTTVMVVGFVNAGLMQLTQAIGVILGSNIGTTITGWIISIKVGKYGLLFIGLGIFPMLFSKNEKAKAFGRTIFGVGMIFMGLETMSKAFKPLRTNQEFLDMISYFSGDNYGSYFASIITGCLLTVIIQSSSAMLGITIALANTGIIGFNTAAALVLGENIGTTITAILASVGATTNAKRAARAHACFNLLGVGIIFSILPMYLNFVDWLVPGDPNLMASDGSLPNVASHVAASHTFFNVSATLLFLPFINILARFVIRITPETEVKEKDKLLVLDHSTDILPATAIIQAHQEVKRFSSMLIKMKELTDDFFKTNDANALSKIHDLERRADKVQKEITEFLCQVLSKRMSSDQTVKVQALIRLADELESIADYFEKIALYRAKYKNSFEIDSESMKEYEEFKEKVWAFYLTAINGLDEGPFDSMDFILRKSEELRILADQMRDKHLNRISSGEVKADIALTYSDIVVSFRKIRAHAMNVAQAANKLH